MIIYRPNGTPLFEVDVDDSSYRYRSIMRSDELTLMFSLAIHVELPIGAYCTFEGDTYTLLSLANVTVRHRRNYEYRITMYSPMERLKNYIIFNPVEGDERLRFDITVNPREHLDLIIANINHREGLVWSAGCYIEGEPRTISYNMTTAWDALVQLANAFNTEFEVAGTSIRLGKVEYNKSNPLSLSYGQGNGLRPGVARLDAQMPIEKVYVQGGNRNIGLDNYDAKTLHLPSMVSFYFNGSNFSQSGVAMQTNDSGTCLFLTGASSYAVEASLDLSDIYPHREGVVSGLVFSYKGNFFDTLGGLNIAYPDLTPQDWYDVIVYFYDNTLPENLDFAMYEMGQEPESVIFQTGNLAGREFNVKFSKAPIVKTLYDDITGETVEVEVVPANNFKMDHATIDGTDMPAPAYLPVPTSGEVVTYGIFNCSLPVQYIRNDPDKTGAEWEMAREAARFLYENRNPKVAYRGELDPLFAKANWNGGLNIWEKIRCGGFVRFTDPSVQATPLDVRITGVRQYVNNPYAPVIEFGNEAIVPSMTNVIKTIDAKEAKIESMIAAVRRFSGRSFADAKETAQMLIDLGLENFTEAISPIVIQTMQLIAGDESLQFQFIRSLTDDTVVGDPVHMFDPDTKTLTIDHSFIKHLTIGITDITAPGSRDPSEYKRWEMARYVSPVLSDPAKKYYIYAMVSESSPTGVYTLSENPIAFKRYTIIEGQQVLAGYSLLVGILTSERDGYRSYGPVYGFTEILPGQITTEVIRSSDGQAFFDLTKRIFQLGDKFVYSPQGGLVLKNALTVTGGGEAVPLGAWCGEWQDEYLYALGDEVWAEVNGEVITFRYVNSTDSAHADPPYPFVTNTDYWLAVARGKAGENGQSVFKSSVFKRSNSSVSTPTGGSFASPIPNPTDGWSDGVPSGEAQLWMSTRIFTGDGLSPQQATWTTPQPVTDTADIDFEFSSRSSNPGNPTSNPSYWHNTATEDDIWMAVRKCRNGAWSSWEITKIKGEDGAPGTPGTPGAPGKGIDHVTEEYAYSTDSTMPVTWDDTYPENIGPGFWVWTKTTTYYTDSTTTVAYTKTASSGTSAPSCFRGQYSNTTLYYGSLERRDIVYTVSGGVKTYYIANSLVGGSFTNKDVNNRAYWLPFQGQFDNLATGLAFIESLYVWNLDTAGGANNTARINAHDNQLTMFDSSNNERLRIVGDEIGASGSNANIVFPAASNYLNYSGTIPFDPITHGSGYSVTGSTSNKTFSITGSGASVYIPSRTITFNIAASGFQSGNIQYLIENGVVVDGTYSQLNSYAAALSPTSDSRNFTLTIPSKTLSLGYGSHSIRFRTDITFSSSSAAAQSGVTSSLSATASFGSAATGTINYPALVTEIGTNGFRVMLGNSNKMAQFIVSNNSVDCVIRTDAYGIKIDDSSIQIMLGTQNEWRTLEVDQNDGTLRLAQP